MNVKSIGYRFPDCRSQGVRQEGITVEADDKEKDKKLVAFRRNIVFPGLLFDLGLTGHREKKLLIKIECEPHNYKYKPIKPIIQKFNVFTQIFAPSPEILLSMKTGAVLERGKGRDYYDFIFLSGITEPDFNYLESKFGITNQTQLYEKILETIETTDFEIKSRDFERHKTNEAFTRGWREEKREKYTEEEISNLREESYQVALAKEKRDAAQSLIRIIIIMLIDIVLFVIHWKIAKRARESLNT